MAQIRLCWTPLALGSPLDTWMDLSILTWLKHSKPMHSMSLSMPLSWTESLDHLENVMGPCWCFWAGPYQWPISCSKWCNDSVQDKGIERGIECIAFEGFNQVRIERSIRVSRGDPSTSYPCASGVQDNLIWAMRWGQQRKQKNPTTWKQHGWLPLPFVSRIKGLHGRL